jgi:mono/diheme cytochrome c family protein
MSNEKRSWAAPLGGVLVGVAVFVGVNISTGRAIVPTVASVSGRTGPAAQPPAPVAVTGPPYQAVCSPCHQTEGQGIPFAFPPLAGSPWLTGDPETPIRIVLLGLGGEIEVNGTKFNLVMPPPGTALPGSTVPPMPLDDAKIAEAITYARANFGNNASAVDAELVKKVRDSLGGRTTPWTATELTALRTGVPGGAAAANADTAPAKGGAAAATGAKKPRSKAAQRVAVPAQ